MTETTLKNKVSAYLKTVPALWFFKVHGSWFQKMGIPDMIGCWQGRFFALELKIEGNLPTPIQSHTIQKIKEAGGIVGVCYTLEDVKKLFEVAQP